MHQLYLYSSFFSQSKIGTSGVCPQMEKENCILGFTPASDISSLNEIRN